MNKPWLRHWPKAIPQTLTYPDIPVPELLARTASKYPDNGAVILFGRTITYRELDSLCDRFGSALSSLGVSRGDRVALFLPNIPQFPICYFGALRAGAVAVPCSPMYRERELEFQLNDSRAETIVALDTLYDRVAAVRSRTKLRNVIITRLFDYRGKSAIGAPMPIEASSMTNLEDVVSFKSFLDRAVEERPKVSIDPKRDPALLQYTGGTTGVPKAAVLTHYNLVANVVQFSSWLPTLRQGSEVVLVALPLFHIFGLTVALNMSILKAAAMVLIPKFEALEVLKTIQSSQVTFFPGVPTMYTALMNYGEIGKFDLKSIRLCISGAMSLPTHVAQRFERLISGRLVEGYGLTEASPVTHCNPVSMSEQARVGSIGIPLPDTEARIADLETGETNLAGNEVGELVIRGPQVMKGYWNRPEETSLVLRDGWLYTGDVARMDEHGSFYIVDRKKDMINVSGLKVWPREVEEVLCEHPHVKEAAVIGVIDRSGGEAVKAFLVLKEGCACVVDSQEIIQFCSARIAAFKVPTHIEFRKELPKTGVGKILRRALGTLPST